MVEAQQHQGPNPDNAVLRRDLWWFVRVPGDIIKLASRLCLALDDLVGVGGSGEDWTGC